MEKLHCVLSGPSRILADLLPINHSSNRKEESQKIRRKNTSPSLRPSNETKTQGDDANLSPNYLDSLRLKMLSGPVEGLCSVDEAFFSAKICWISTDPRLESPTGSLLAEFGSQMTDGPGFEPARATDDALEEDSSLKKMESGFCP